MSLSADVSEITQDACAAGETTPSAAALQALAAESPFQGPRKLKAAASAVSSAGITDADAFIHKGSLDQHHLLETVEPLI